MKTFFLYVRRFDIFEGGYKLFVYKVFTDNLYRVIGKFYCTSLEEIKLIDYNFWSPDLEYYWIKNGYEILDYKEPKLSCED